MVPNVSVPQTTQPVINVSERAVTELQNVMKSEGVAAQGLRLGLEPGGCAGYQYSLSFAEAAQGDEVAVDASGIKIFVQRKDSPLLNGLKIDYVESHMGSGFNIQNPNAKSTCGCGSTFDA
jgi:iron-sulfur cluster assembly accessory protein